MSKGRAGFTGHLLTLAGFIAVFLVCLGYLLYQAGTLPTLGEKYRLSAEVPTGNFLASGARVTVAGAEVGQVKSVNRAGKLSPNTTVELELTDDRVFPLPDDSRVQIRTRSQVGENYLNIVVGNSKTTVPSNGSLGLDNADEFVSVDQILSVLRGKTKARTRTLLKQLGVGLDGRGPDLNATLGPTASFVDYGVQTLDTLMPDRRALAQLVDQLGHLTAAIGDRTQAIETASHQGVVSLEAIASRDRRLAQTLHDLPPTLQRVRRTTEVVGDVSDRATPVVANLAAATRELRPAVAALAPAASDGRAIVARLADAIPELQGLLKAAPGLTGYPGTDGERAGLLAATGPLRDVFCELNPALRYLEPYIPNLYSVVRHLGSNSNAYDATGHLVRLTPLINENSLSGAPPLVLQSAKTLLSSGVLIPQKRIAYQAYPEPGDVGKVRANAGDPTTPAEYAKTFKYPRVEAEC